MSDPQPVHSFRPKVHCHNCHTKVFDGIVVKSRVIRVLPKGAEAKCGQCKEWVAVPLTYSVQGGRV